jgi:hypothetical protein
VFLGSFNLLQAPFGAGFGDGEIFTAFVAVPETAIHKDYGFVFGKNKSGLPGKSFTCKR